MKVLDVLILRAVVLYYPQDGDLSPKYSQECMCMDNLRFYVLCARITLVGWLVGWFVGWLDGWLVCWLVGLLVS
jgi:hypothetical protein